MRKSSHPLIDLLWALLLVISLPVLALLAGPLLTAAAIWGRISFLGILQLNPGRYRRRGRGWALLIGLLVWGLSWCGAVWLVGKSDLPALAGAVKTENTPVVAAVTPPPTATPLPLQTSTPPPPTIAVTATGTPLPPTATAPPPTTPAPTPTPSPEATATPSPAVTSSPAPAPTPSPALTATLSLVTLAPLPEAEALQALAEANNLLVQAIEAPTTANINALASAWQGEALLQVQGFIEQVRPKYQLPLRAGYSTIGIPVLGVAAQTPDLLVQSREYWTFEDALGKRESLADYTYTMRRQNEGWIIISYQYKIIPLTGPNVVLTPAGGRQ